MTPCNFRCVSTWLCPTWSSWEKWPIRCCESESCGELQTLETGAQRGRGGIIWGHSWRRATHLPPAGQELNTIVLIWEIQLCMIFSRYYSIKNKQINKMCLVNCTNTGANLRRVCALHPHKHVWHLWKRLLFWNKSHKSIKMTLKSNTWYKNE